MDKNKEIEKELELEIQKELQLEYEKEHLATVIELINVEILKYIDKRKEISKYILDYRKKMVEEYKDDEDQVMEYFDHERFVKEEAFKTIDRRFKELTTLNIAPYFGKIHFKEEDSEEGDTIYIGRFGMTPEGTYDPVVVDWRAPIASLFYAGKLGNVSYTAPMGVREAEILAKRQFIIKKKQLIGMFDSTLDVKDEILQWVLSRNTGEKLKDIIMTIQAEQDGLLRQPRNKTIVVDGVAGSGKTTVALHRVAYLLYNFREILQDKVLILGPNAIFMEYISTVLPSLGEVGVKQQTFREFALNLIDLPQVMSFKTYMEKVIGGDKEFLKEVEYKTSAAYLEEVEQGIETLNCNYFKIQPVTFCEKIVVTLEEIQEMFQNHYKNMPLFRRSKKIKRIIFSRIKDARDEEVRRIQAEYKAELMKSSKDELQHERNSLDYMRKTKIRELIQNVIETKKKLTWMKNPDCIDIYTDWNGDKELTVDDLAPILYLKIKLEGLKMKEEIKHVVIDEAQDYSALQFKVIQEVTKCNFFTIVGDKNQRMVPIKGEIPMTQIQNVLQGAEVEHFKLDKSYRSTMEIMNYANQYLGEEKIVPLVRNGATVEEIKFNSLGSLKEKVIKTLEIFKEKGYENVAILCKDMKDTEKVSKELKEVHSIKILDKEEMHYSGGVVILPSYFAKGMEFDAVIVVENQELEAQNKMKYVMATRALHELCIYKI